MPNVITLYQGTTFSFDTVDISRGKPYKDFGAGFYTSKIKDHAYKMALRNKEIEQIRRKDNHVNAFVYSFELDLDQLNYLDIKEFTSADREWMRFIVKNRSEIEFQHNYDLVIGPTANDNTLTAIGLFFAGAYGDVTSDNAIDRLIEQIEPQKLPHQYFFGSRKAAELLVLITRETLV